MARSPSTNQRQYRYVGMRDAEEYLTDAVPRIAVHEAHDILAWMTETGQKLSPENTIVATFIIDTDGQLWISDRHSEHVVCARGGDVLSAGEITFAIHKQRVEVVEITNQSTGYCPEPESWSAVAAALEKTGLPFPAEFTTAYLFRRCEKCGTTNIVKDNWFECGVCGAALSKTWNYQSNG
jgi:hypothetical protein